MEPARRTTRRLRRRGPGAGRSGGRFGGRSEAEGLGVGQRERLGRAFGDQGGESRQLPPVRVSGAGQPLLDLAGGGPVGGLLGQAGDDEVHKSGRQAVQVRFLVDRTEEDPGRSAVAEGRRPVAAYTRTQPSEKTSQGGPSLPPMPARGPGIPVCRSPRRSR
ncbi:hypothetical protein NKH18_41070 [Streptomyces sp. M10(2022)]